jgi:predicted hydrocarbon binding protein
MNRKDFLKNGGVTCCAAAIYFSTIFKGIASGKLSAQENVKSLSGDLDKRITNGAKSPEWQKADKGRHWVKSMMDHIDEYVDEEMKQKLMFASGKSCFINAMGVADKKTISPLPFENFLQSIEKQGFKVEKGEKKIIIYYGWGSKQNPWGLSMKEGFCMCPIFESDTKGVSPSFCLCSTGYVKEALERYSGKKVHKIEVTESILRGGKDCKFRIEFLNS